MIVRNGKGTINRMLASRQERKDEAGRLWKILREFMFGSKHNIMLGFVDITKHPIEQSNGCLNQVVVCYDSGRFDILPLSVNGTEIKKYLGYKFLKIRYWSALPSYASEKNPCGNKKKALKDSLQRDIYECI